MTNYKKRYKTYLLQGVPIIVALIAYFIANRYMSEAAARMLGIFTFAALYWALEAIPLFATSVLVVLLEIFLLAKPDGVLDMDKMGYTQFLLPLGSPIIILFFGGFVLACAMQKYSIDQYFAARFVRVIGQNTYKILLGFMFITGFFSMWMSNTATTAMMIAMFTPILKQLNITDRYRTCLVLSIPFAANIGGMGTPIGTPPNAIAMGLLAHQGVHVAFISWMKIAFPLAIVLLIVASWILYFLFPPKRKKIQIEISEETQLTGKSKKVIIIVVIAIVLWLTATIHKIPSAVIALLAASILITGNLINRNDIKNLDWDILILIWGGLALGKGMSTSGLTDWIVNWSFFSETGFIIIILFSLFAVVFATFMSNTATANLLIPIAIAIPSADSLLLVVAATFSCSVSMALPVSTPPNAIAFSTNMIKSRDMLKSGTVISGVSVLIILLLAKVMSGVINNL